MVASARFELANATVKVWCLTAWLRGNKSGGERWIRTIEPEGTDLQSAAFSHFATSPSNIFNFEVLLFSILVASAGFELANVAFRVRCLTTWLRGNINGAGNRTWTHNLLITSQLLYQLSYSGKKNGGRYRTRTYDPLLVRQVL